MLSIIPVIPIFPPKRRIKRRYRMVPTTDVIICTVNLLRFIRQSYSTKFTFVPTIFSLIIYDPFVVIDGYSCVRKDQDIHLARSPHIFSVPLSKSISFGKAPITPFLTLSYSWKSPKQACQIGRYQRKQKYIPVILSWTYSFLLFLTKCTKCLFIVSYEYGREIMGAAYGERSH